MNASKRRAAAVGLTLVLVGGCSSSVIDGRGQAASNTGPRSTASGGGFPSSPSTGGTGSIVPSPPATGGTSGTGGARVTSTAGDFSVVLPAGWSDDKPYAASHQLAAVYIGPTSNAFAANVNVVRESTAGLPLQQYLQQALTRLRAALPIKNLSTPTSTTIGGEPALTYTFSDSQAGYTVQQAQVVVLHSGEAYIITYTASSGAPYRDSAPAALSIQASWNWG